MPHPKSEDHFRGAGKKRADPHEVNPEETSGRDDPGALISWSGPALHGDVAATRKSRTAARSKPDRREASRGRTAEPPYSIAPAPRTSWDRDVQGVRIRDW